MALRMMLGQDHRDLLLGASKLLEEAAGHLSRPLVAQEHEEVADCLRNVVKFLLPVADAIDPRGANLLFLEIPMGILADGWAAEKAAKAKLQGQVDLLTTQVQQLTAQLGQHLTDAADVTAAQEIEALAPASPQPSASSAGTASAQSGS